jgi:hypothetical protein
MCAPSGCQQPAPHQEQTRLCTTTYMAANYSTLCVVALAPTTNPIADCKPLLLVHG